MKRNQNPWPVFTAFARRRQIDPRPAYQRGLVWSLKYKQLLIDSILREFDIPKFYLRRIDREPYNWEILDGQQRLNAIWEFRSDEFPVSDDADPVNGHEIAGLFYKDLHYDVSGNFDSYPLDVVTVDEAEDNEIEDMFLRLQHGIPLNAAEKRNAIGGGIRDFIRELAESHKLMTQSVNIDSARYSHDEIIAQMLLVEMHGGPTSLHHNRLEKMYRDYKSFRESSSVATKLKKVLNFLARAFPKQTPELSKVNVISLYIVASESLEKYAISNRAGEIGHWFVGFENRRKPDEDKPEDELDEGMVDYRLSLLQRTAGQSSLKTRRDFLTHDMIATIPDLMLLDDQREFTSEQKIAIYRKANGECVNPNYNPDCSGHCDWDNWHADHIVPHSRGGRTTVENGQLLCPSCNLKKSNKES